MNDSYFIYLFDEDLTHHILQHGTGTTVEDVLKERKIKNKSSR
jgi:hypothetical protein